MSPIISLVISWIILVADNLRFIVFNWGFHIVAALVLSSAVYAFLSKNYKKRLNYFLFVFFPALFGSEFPDILFTLSTLIKYGTSKNLIFILEHGGYVHAVFHKDIALLLVIPSTVFIILVIISLINKTIRFKEFLSQKISFIKAPKLEKIKLDCLPNKWIVMSSVISLVAAVSHIIMDLVGF